MVGFADIIKNIRIDGDGVRHNPALCSNDSYHLMVGVCFNILKSIMNGMGVALSALGAILVAIG